MSVVHHSSGRNSSYQGWKVLGGAFTCALLAIGSTVYIFGLLVLPLSSDFNLSRADVNTGLIVLLIGFALWGALFGRLLDRLPARAVMAAGGLLLGTGLVVISRSQSVGVMLAATVLLVALGATVGGSLAANTVTSRWFRRRRGRAMGIIAVATSGGGFLMPPVMAVLISQFGWRDALTILGISIAVIMVTSALLFVRDRPTEQALRAAGELDSGATVHASLDAEEPVWTLKQFLSTPNFWFIMLGTALLLTSDQAVIASQIPYYLGKGVGMEAASILLAVQSASAVAGKLLVGFLAERFDMRRLFGLVAGAHVAMLLLFIFWPGYWAMLLAVALIGVAIGGVYPVWMVLMAAAFGSRNFGQIQGTMMLGISIFSIAGLRFIGEVYDRTGGYESAFGVFLVGAIISFILVSLVRTGPGGSRPVPATA
ncbi:hypothetical protein MB02_10270 [Croceicoccus estronivorus]|uniref:MFS transporter n=1 Tax=Croceicoccus estronivorus TaxID=1172626 RepID=UPI00082F4D4E|nr:MFS transporter [Croceicoccus estronivorus]OCC23556.1 hypothetical protein MB02_10270 [Croceicoccus estronivorus]